MSSLIELYEDHIQDEPNYQEWSGVDFHHTSQIGTLLSYSFNERNVPPRFTSECMYMSVDGHPCCHPYVARDLKNFMAFFIPTYSFYIYLEYYTFFANSQTRCMFSHCFDTSPREYTITHLSFVSPFS